MAKYGVGIVCLVLMSCLAVQCYGESYNVGDTSGWSLGVDYGTWAAAKTFKVGDTLVFNYGSSHTVSEVSESDYSACSASKPISTDNTGATSIPLKTAGKHYFICSVSGHCDGGMKLQVTVAEAGGSSDSPTTNPPSGNTNTSPASGAGTTVSQGPPTTTSANPHPTEYSFASKNLSPFAAVSISCAALMITKLVLL